MPTTYSQHVPPDAQIFTGKRGGKYFLKDGVKVYIMPTKPTPNRSFQPRRGAYKRFIENQSSLV